jgi:hypothetical protein
MEAPRPTPTEPPTTRVDAGRSLIGQKDTKCHSSSAGNHNKAEGESSSVSGGKENKAVKNFSAILGGKLKETTTEFEALL